MALTTVEEQQLRELLVHFEGLGDVGAAAATILAELGAQDVVVVNLPAANPLAANDTLYVAQSGADVKATIQQLANFILPLLPSAQEQADAALYRLGKLF